MNDIELWFGDCLIEMQKIPDKSIDMIFADLPYKKGMGKWDSLIDLELLWKQYMRVIKDRRAILLFAQKPFSAKLLLSNEDWYKYDWIWDKGKAGNIFSAKLYPLITHEEILVFSNGTIANGSKRQMIYYPQMEKLDSPQKYKISKKKTPFSRKAHKQITYTRTHKYPKSIFSMFNTNLRGKLHPTQKPVPLLEYFIKTYTLEGEIVLDNTMGSGSTGIAARNLNRRFIGIENNKKYFNIAVQRVTE